MKRAFWILLVLIAATVLSGLAAGAPAPSAAPSKIKGPPPTNWAPSKSAAAEKLPAVVDSVGLLERAVANDSSNWDNLYRLGVMYLDKDRVAGAQTVFMKASKLRPNDVATLVNLGAAYDQDGNSQKAQDAYNQALAVSPGDSIATCRLASSLYANSQYQKAVDLLRDLIVKKPRAHCAYFTLGVAFADAGIYKDAVRMWKKVIELAPNSQEAISAKESIDVLERVIKGQ